LARTAKGSGRTKTDIIEPDNEDIWRASGGSHARHDKCQITKSEPLIDHSYRNGILHKNF